MYNKFWIREKSRALMHDILHDNGAVNRQEQEHIDENWLDKITAKLETVILNNDNIASIDEVCDDLVFGEVSEVSEKYGHLVGFYELNQILNDYFEQI